MSRLSQSLALTVDGADFDHFLMKYLLDTNGEIRSALERDGSPIGSMDLLIAAHAKSLNRTLVTNNERAFTRVKHLTIENWLKT